MKKIIIVGAGISGLAAAYALEKQRQAGVDIDYEILEKDDRVGGKVATDVIDDFVVEGGPDCFILDKPWALYLARELGLEDELLNTNDAYKGSFILSRGKLFEIPDGLMMMVPTKIIPFITTGLFSWRGKLRMGMDLIIPKKKVREDETLESFVLRRLGREALDRIAEPLVGGIHAGDPRTMSILATFPRFIDMEQNHGCLIKGMLASRKEAAERAKKRPPGPKRTFFISMKKGMAELTDAIAAALPQNKIQLNTEVDQILPVGSGYEVKLSSGDTVYADVVICTVPAFEAAREIASLNSELGQELTKIPYRSSATVSLAYNREDIGHDLDGYGFVVPHVENRGIMAATFSSQKWLNRAPADKVLIRAFVGGPYGQSQLELSDDDMTAMVEKELKVIIDVQAQPLFAKIFRWEQGMPQYVLGHLDWVARLEALLDKNPGLYLAGAAYRGVGLPDCINNATLTTAKALKYLGLAEQEQEVSTPNR